MNQIEKCLYEEIEFAVTQLLNASQSAAHAIIDEAFNENGKSKRRCPTKRSKRDKSRNVGRHRNSAEIDKLGERFIEMVVEEPGQTMGVLAPKCEATARELYTPIIKLKAKGKIKTVGHRQLTRYFPVVDAKETAGDSLCGLE